MYLKIEILTTNGILNLLLVAAVLLESDTMSGTIKETPSYTQIEVKLQDPGLAFKKKYIIFLNSFKPIIEMVLEQIRALLH